MTYLIDPPSPFDTLDAWRTFLVEMKAIRDPDDLVKQTIADAEKIIADRTRANDLFSPG